MKQRITKPRNFGKAWNARDLRFLRDYVNERPLWSVKKFCRILSKVLNRSEGGIASRVLIVRTAQLLNEPDNTTVFDLKRKQKENAKDG